MQLDIPEQVAPPERRGRTLSSSQVVDLILRHYGKDSNEVFRVEQTSARLEQSKMLCLSATEAIGAGLVALRTIEKNEIVALYSGTVRSYEEIQRDERLLRERQQLDTYTLSLGGPADDLVLNYVEPGNYFSTHYVVDGRGPEAEKDLAIYANHQCTNPIVSFQELAARNSALLPLENQPLSVQVIEELQRLMGTQKITLFFYRDGDHQLSQQRLEELNAHYDRVADNFKEDWMRESWRVTRFSQRTKLSESRQSVAVLAQYALLVRYYNASILLMPLRLCQACYYDDLLEEFVTREKLVRAVFLNGQATCLAYYVQANDEILAGDEIVINYGEEYSSAENDNNYQLSEPLQKYHYGDRSSLVEVEAGELRTFDIPYRVLGQDRPLLDRWLRDGDDWYERIIAFFLDTIVLLQRLLLGKLFTLADMEEFYFSEWERYDLDGFNESNFGSIFQQRVVTRTLFYFLGFISGLAASNFIEAIDCRRLRRRLLTSGYINFPSLGEYHANVQATKRSLDDAIRVHLGASFFTATELHLALKTLSEEQLEETVGSDIIEQFSPYHSLLLMGWSNYIFRDVFYVHYDEGLRVGGFVEASLRSLQRRKVFDDAAQKDIFGACHVLYDEIETELAQIHVKSAIDRVKQYRELLRKRPLCESCDALEIHFVLNLHHFVRERRLLRFLNLLHFYQHLNLTLRLLPVLDLDNEWLHRKYESNYGRFFYAHQMLIGFIENETLDIAIARLEIRDEFEWTELSEIAERRQEIDRWREDPLDEPLQRLDSVVALQAWLRYRAYTMRERHSQAVYNRFSFEENFEQTSERCPDLDNWTVVANGIFSRRIGDVLYVMKHFTEKMGGADAARAEYGYSGRCGPICWAASFETLRILS